MPLFEINLSRYVSASVRLDGSTAEPIDPYANFVHVCADDVVDKALNHVFSQDRDFQHFLKAPQAKQVASTLRVRRDPNKRTEGAKEQPARKLAAGVESTDYEGVIPQASSWRSKNGASHRKNLDTPSLKGLTFAGDCSQSLA